MKKRMNNKGFTLVELLAVLVILILILTIAIPSITSSVDRNKNKVLNKKIDIIEAQSESYVNLYKNKISSYSTFKNGNCCIDINVMKDVGLLTSEDLKDADENIITGYFYYNTSTKEYVYESSCARSSGVCS